MVNGRWLMVKCKLQLKIVLDFQKSSINPPGTLAYITEEEALLVRVDKGWQYIAVSDKCHPFTNILIKMYLFQ